VGAPSCRTERLILEPIGPEHVDELWLLHQDPVVAAWYGGTWSRAEATAFAARCAQAWATEGVSKWIARDRGSGRMVGRGGLSRMARNAVETPPIEALLADTAWAQDRLELGWALLSTSQGRGLATEIGREGLRFAFEVLGAGVVISYTERHNLASRRVMGRLGLHLRGEIQGVGLVEGNDDLHDDAAFTVYVTQ
jgi:RimJ/RimL family protein N-acetyltransferase